MIEGFFNKEWCKKDFLTEDDIKCNLFCYLKPRLPELFFVHTEIRFYGREHILADRPDIVILDLDSIDIVFRKV